MCPVRFGGLIVVDATFHLSNPSGLSEPARSHGLDLRQQKVTNLKASSWQHHTSPRPFLNIEKKSDIDLPCKSSKQWISPYRSHASRVLACNPVRRTSRTDPGDAEVLFNRSKGNVAGIRANTNWYARGPSLLVFPLLSPVLFQRQIHFTVLIVKALTPSTVAGQMIIDHRRFRTSCASPRGPRNQKEGGPLAVYSTHAYPNTSIKKNEGHSLQIPPPRAHNVLREPYPPLPPQRDSSFLFFPFKRRILEKPS